MTGVLESVRLLAQLAMRESGADVFTLYAIDPASGGHVEHCSSGVPVPDAGIDGFQVVSYSLRSERKETARLVFAFQGQQVPVPAQRVLGRMVAVIETAWELSQLTTTYARLGARLGSLEEELASSKIADRTRGLLAERSVEDAVEMVAHHVEGVARKLQFRATLPKLLQEMEDELVLRRLTGQAKAVLQNIRGMSEEEAHHHLRVTSRRSRRSVKDVAQELIETRK